MARERWLLTDDEADPVEVIAIPGEDYLLATVRVVFHNSDTMYFDVGPDGTLDTLISTLNDARALLTKEG